MLQKQDAGVPRSVFIVVILAFIFASAVVFQILLRRYKITQIREARFSI
jgi:hypothetical protein